MEPYAAIIGQQGHKSKLGEYKLKAFKRQKYQCVNLAGRAFTTYLDDVPAKMMWADGRVAELYKEDKLYTVLNEITTPGGEYISELVIKASEVSCFYGDGVQLADTGSEYERLKQEQEVYLHEKSRKKVGSNSRHPGPKGILEASSNPFESVYTALFRLRFSLKLLPPLFPSAPNPVWSNMWSKPLPQI